MAGKFYAVKKGKVPGIYTSWDACKSMVHGFPGAVYKGFATRAEAEQFLEEKKEEQSEIEKLRFEVKKAKEKNEKRVEELNRKHELELTKLHKEIKDLKSKLKETK